MRGKRRMIRILEKFIRGRYTREQAIEKICKTLNKNGNGAEINAFLNDLARNEKWVFDDLADVAETIICTFASQPDIQPKQELVSKHQPQPTTLLRRIGKLSLIRRRVGNESNAA